MNTVIADIAAARARLAKRATFEAAISELCAIANDLKSVSGYSEQQEMWGACRRAHQLLKSRYSSPPFWNAGQHLFIAAQCLSIASNFHVEVGTWLTDSNDALGEEAPQSSATRPAADRRTSAAAASLFEGQLSAERPGFGQAAGQHDQILQTMLSQLMREVQELPDAEREAAGQLPEAVQQFLRPHTRAFHDSKMYCDILSSLQSSSVPNTS